MTFLINPFRFGGGAGLPTVTWNPSDKSADLTLSAGDRTVTKTGGGDSHRSVRATRGIAHTDSGYFEVRIDAGGTGPAMLIGIANLSAALGNYVGVDTNGWSYYQDTGTKVTNAVGTAFGASYTTADIVGVAFKNGSVWFAKNNTYQGSGNPAAGTNAAFTGITGTLYPMVSPYRQAAPAHVLTGRFNAATCTYAPPAGFNYWGG